MPKVEDSVLARLAEEALLQEAKRGALRAEMAGPSGWLRPRLHATNKTFLKNTIKGALAANLAHDRKRKIVKEQKLQSYERQLKEQKRYKRVYLQASTKIKSSDSICISSTQSKMDKDSNHNFKCKYEIKNESDNKKSSFVNEISWKEDGSLEVSNKSNFQQKSKNRTLKSGNVNKLSSKITFVREGEIPQITKDKT